jgi:UDP-glucose 4-epimerase
MSRRRVLITGGAGYIGSHVTRELVEQGDDVTVVDLLRKNGGTGNDWAVPRGVRLIQGDCGDGQLLRGLLAPGERFDAILHFAAFILVEESVREPMRYFENNVNGSRRLFQYAVETQVPQIIFSSTAATYAPKIELLKETDTKLPANPYGESKLQAEKVLTEICDANPATRYVTLRYFNPAGAHASLEIGQARSVASALVNVAAEVAVGKRNKLLIYGDDYSTPDGTCLRDYIHVQDLTRAHTQALEYLDRGGVSDVFNVGYGRCYSVREVIQAMKSVSGVDFQVETVARRPGDADRLGADVSKVRASLGWKPQFDSIEQICNSHYMWEKKYTASRGNMS